MTDYERHTDEIHEVSLPSALTHALWDRKRAVVGDRVGFVVRTHFVGNGSEINVKVTDKKGKNIEKLKGKVFGDYYKGYVNIPKNAKESLSFTAKLPEQGLELDSNVLTLIPPILIQNMAWSQSQARRGDIVTLSADTEEIPDDTEVMIYIYEYDQDRVHDFITKFPTRVKQNKIEIEWEYEYHEDTDEISTEEEMQEYGKHYNPPEYFWVAEVAGRRFGEEQESGLLEFKDWIEIKIVDAEGFPIANADYEIQFADGATQRGSLDADGITMLENIAPGKCKLSLPDFSEFGIKFSDSGKPLDYIKSSTAHQCEIDFEEFIFSA